MASVPHTRASAKPGIAPRSGYQKDFTYIIIHAFHVVTDVFVGRDKPMITSSLYKREALASKIGDDTWAMGLPLLRLCMNHVDDVICPE